MICRLGDHLKPLPEYAKAADTELIKEPVVKIYTNVLEFGWKARRVFIDVSGIYRKWLSLRAFMYQPWETFEAEFVSTEDEMRHNCEVLSHSVPARLLNNIKNTELERQRMEKVNGTDTPPRREVEVPFLGLDDRV